MKDIFKKIIYHFWRIYNIQVLDYRTRVSIEEKRDFLKELQKKYSFDNLVETGTYLGDTPFYLQNYFKKIFSIELSDLYYKKASVRFENTHNIEIIKGDSGEKLSEIIQNLDSSYMFWLDGHYSLGDTARGSTSTPIYKELSSIFQKNIKKHIILIDDARLFIGRNEYPTLTKLKKYIDKTTQNKYRISINKDIVILEPNL